MQKIHKQNFSLYALSWIEIIGLKIAPDLLGEEMSFELSSQHIRIRLPTIDVCNIPPKEYGNDEIKCLAYHLEDGKYIPKYFDVLRIRVEINVLDTPLLPTDILNVQNNAYEILPPDNQQILNDISFNYEEMANHAFDAWCRTLRWKSRNGSIGRANISHTNKAGTSRLYEANTKKCIWVGGSGRTSSGRFPGGQFITHEVWENASRALLTFQRPPSYIDLFFDGEDHLKNGYLARSVIDFAIAAEILIRRNLQVGLPKDIQKKIFDDIVKSNITNIFPKYGPTIFGNKKWEKLKENKVMIDTIRDLFIKRNQIVHYADSAELSLDGCEKYRLTVAELINNWVIKHG